MTNAIGLNAVSSEKLAKELNALLASYQVFYTNVRGYHWNIKGVSFFELHAKFEEIYDDLVVKIDEIAERILTLGHVPHNGFSQYLTSSRINEDLGAQSAQHCLSGTLTGFQTLLKQQREIMNLANTLEDEGTAAQMSDYIKEQEKQVWMFSAAATCGVCSA